MANAKETVEAVKTAAENKVEETVEAVKTMAEAIEAKAEEANTEEAKTEESPAEETKPEKKRPGRKPGSKNKTTKEKAAAKKEACTPEIYVQFGASESSVQAAVDKIKGEYIGQGHRASSIKSLKVYLKPEDNAAYYVINEKVAGRVDLF